MVNWRLGIRPWAQKELIQNENDGFNALIGRRVSFHAGMLSFGLLGRIGISVSRIERTSRSECPSANDGEARDGGTAQIMERHADDAGLGYSDAP